MPFFFLSRMCVLGGAEPSLTFLNSRMYRVLLTSNKFPGHYAIHLTRLCNFIRRHYLLTRSDGWKSKYSRLYFALYSVNSSICYLCFLFLFPFFTERICLKNITLRASKWVIKYRKEVTLYCDYNLEGDKLLNVKWYRGNREFFRFVPKDHPQAKTFPILSTRVDVSITSFLSFFLFIVRTFYRNF